MRFGQYGYPMEERPGNKQYITLPVYDTVFGKTFRETGAMAGSHSKKIIGDEYEEYKLIPLATLPKSADKPASV